MNRSHKLFPILLFGFSVQFAISFSLAAADDLLIEDFEADDYKSWKVEGEAFGQAPAEGTLPNQMGVSGYRGDRLVNTFTGGDASTGTATSPKFTIQRNHIAFLIGGGPHHDQVGIELLIDGQRVRSATGPESEQLEWHSWKVTDHVGQNARIRIFDKATGGWGHINVDHIIQTNDPPSRFDLEERIAEYRRSRDYMNEALRPQFHFTPEINWMNDPNGLVFHDGEYHLFHQYNPAGNAWGHMSWGHAVSSDLVHWKHLPLAIPEENGIMAFSGCCVIDHDNTTGFGTGGKTPMVAVYTGHGRGKQVQNLAYSNDNGRTWTEYDQNPVIDLNNADFRDPKVFWHEPTARWIMVVSLAKEKVLVFYASADLKHWDELSRFGPAGAKSKTNWECPDLFELAVEGPDGKPLAGKTMWVLEADMGSGSIAGGSGGEYFVGHFDGTKFTATQEAQWVDFGRDFYAPISWDNIPEADGRRIWIGWYNNWETCLVPTSPWRSCMSVPRSLALRQVPREDGDGNQLVMTQRPVEELSRLRGDARIIDASGAEWPPAAVTEPGDLNDLMFELETTLRPGDARSLGFRIRTGEDEYTEFGYDRKHGAVYVDRTKSGNVDFHNAFAGRHEAPSRLIDGQVKLRVFVDRSSIEVFINDGEAVISDRIFPSSNQPVLEVFAGDDSAKITETKLYPLSSIWQKP